MENSEIRIPVAIGGITFKNPFYVASGPTVKTVRQLQRIEETGWAGASIKLTIDPAPYINRKPRYGLFKHQHALAFTTEKRLTMAEGLRLVEEGKKVLRELILMANITYAGDAGAKGWVNMAKQFEAAGVDIIELNMCCPNMSYNLEVSGVDDSKIKIKTGASMGKDEEIAAEIVSAIANAISIPLFVKLTPEGGNIAQVAKALYAAGADAVGSTANRLGIPPINLDNPASSCYALQDEISISCYSNAWVKPLAQRDTYEIRKLNGPEPFITATGGITNWRDAVEMILCGGNLLGVCSETLISGYDIARPMIKGLKDYMDSHHYKDLSEFRGMIVSEVRTSEEVTLHDGYARIMQPNLSAPCKAACPHHVPAQAYIQKVAKGEFRDAYTLITAKNPLQEICGLVCSAPCEDACTLGKVSRPVEIRAIKRFVLEYGRAQGWPEGGEMAKENGHRVAVIGAGPAGLTCAVMLRRAGYDVTIFERENELGGNLRYAIPPFRLDQQRLKEEIDRIMKYGMKIQFGKELGRDITVKELEEEGYESIFIAAGAQRDDFPNVPGVTAQGVISASEFLKSLNQKKSMRVGKSVVVIGDSYLALDASRSAIRLGAEKVTLVSNSISKRRRALQKNLQEAQEEGVRFIEGVDLKQIFQKEGKVAGIELVNKLGLTMRDECETVILEGERGVGAIVDEAMLNKGLIEIDTRSGATLKAGVFAGGDATRLGNIIDAIAAGKRAAVSIDQYIRKDAATLEYTQNTVVVDTDKVLQRVGYLKDSSRAPQTFIRMPKERMHSFEPFDRVLTKDEAIAEASRCLNCGCGEGCQLCKTICCEFAPDIVSPDILGIEAKLCVACGMCYQRCPLQNIEMVNTDLIK